VDYFESLTPDLTFAEDTWSIESLEPHSNDELHFTPSSCIFREKKVIPIGLNKLIVKNSIEEPPNEGHNLPLNGAFAISENTGDNNNITESNENIDKVDDKVNVQ
jgi:hypothetical protein